MVEIRGIRARRPRRNIRLIGSAVAGALLMCGVADAAAALQAGDDPAMFEAVRQADGKIATIGWRLASANATLCDRLEPGTGIQLHTLDQFDAGSREAARRHFGFATPIAVEDIVAGTPAERAGLKPDDSVVRIGPVEVADIAGRPGTTDRLVATQLAIAALPASAPIDVEAVRAGVRVHVTIQPVPICKTRFELRIANDFGASADGAMVQIASRFLEDYPDDQLAAVMAHEFAHNILHHREQLTARGVAFGMLSGFGASVKYFRQTELQADILSVYLLANAGYAPEGATAFWRKFGPSKAGGILRSRSHPAWRDRIATLQAEISKLRTSSTRPITPAILAARDQPLSGDWQSLLVRDR